MWVHECGLRMIQIGILNHVLNLSCFLSLPQETSKQISFESGGQFFKCLSWSDCASSGLMHVHASVEVFDTLRTGLWQQKYCTKLQVAGSSKRDLRLFQSWAMHWFILRVNQVTKQYICIRDEHLFHNLPGQGGISATCNVALLFLPSFSLKLPCSVLLASSW